jgi:hypothetical protein
MVKRRAIALVAVPEPEKLHTAYVGTEVVANVRSHEHPILLADNFMVPPLFLFLRVPDAADTPIPRRAALRCDVIFAGKLEAGIINLIWVDCAGLEARAGNDIGLLACTAQRADGDAAEHGEKASKLHSCRKLQ